jgi:hypothetical protein
MVNAVISGGEIRPLEPLPPDWQEGQRLRIERADESEPTAEDIDRDFAVLAAMCETSAPADEEKMRQALREAEELAKEQMRREMGLK